MGVLHSANDSSWNAEPVEESVGTMRATGAAARRLCAWRLASSATASVGERR